MKVTGTCSARKCGTFHFHTECLTTEHEKSVLQLKYYNGNTDFRHQFTFWYTSDCLCEVPTLVTLGYGKVSSARGSPRFHRNLLPPFSTPWRLLQKLLMIYQSIWHHIPEHRNLHQTAYLIRGLVVPVSKHHTIRSYRGQVTAPHQSRVVSVTPQPLRCNTKQPLTSIRHKAVSHSQSWPLPLQSVTTVSYCTSLHSVGIMMRASKLNHADSP
jgi:hypothetical protein